MSPLSELCKEITLCHQCEIAKYRTKVVPGEGAEDADIMFIGEAPGWHEDQQGRPFVGPAGLYLEELLASKIQACRKWLDRQIELIQPKMIVTLGRYSMAMYFPGKSISKIHGTAQRQNNVLYYAMYHPAAALHQQSLRQAIGADMLKIPSLLAQAEIVAEAKPQPQQLTML